MSQGIDAYPLHWPAGRKRNPKPDRSRFMIKSFEGTRKQLFRELELLGARQIILSTNLPLRNDGMPYATARKPADPGVAVYFQYKGRPTCIACDRWDRVEDNIHALELTVAALRGLDRWGSTDMVERSFSGFAALPAPEQEAPWWEVLQVRPGASYEDTKEAFKRLARKYHPDSGPEASHDMMTKINKAWEKAQAEDLW